MGDVKIQCTGEPDCVCYTCVKVPSVRKCYELGHTAGYRNRGLRMALPESLEIYNDLRYAEGYLAGWIKRDMELQR